jgi:hypothetical protein
MNSSLSPQNLNPAGLCPSCAFAREIVSGKGSRFLLCEKSKTDRRFPKYPRQPVIQCHGFAEKQPEGEQAARTEPFDEEQIAP